MSTIARESLSQLALKHGSCDPGKGNKDVPVHSITDMSSSVILLICLPMLERDFETCSAYVELITSAWQKHSPLIAPEDSAKPYWARVLLVD